MSEECLIPISRKKLLCTPSFFYFAALNIQREFMCCLKSDFTKFLLFFKIIVRKIRPVYISDRVIARLIILLLPFIDLAALNIQRGRDHGLPGYNLYRAICNLTRADDFNGLRREIAPPVIERLRRTYAHVDDVDLFTGW